MRNYIIAITCGVIALCLIGVAHADEPVVVVPTITLDMAPVDAGVDLGHVVTLTDAAGAVSHVDIDTLTMPRNIVIMDSSGSVAAKIALPAAAALPNPIEHPAEALTDVQLTRKSGWPFAVWAVLAMIGKALAYSRDKLKGGPLGKLAMWLAVGKRAMVVAAIGAVGTAGYDVLLAGGTVTAALMASGFAVAGIVSSTTKPTAGAPDVPQATTRLTGLGSPLPMLCVLVLGVGLVTQIGCTATTQQTALKAAYVTTITSCDAFAAYDLQHQEDLRLTATSAEDAVAKVGAWRKARLSVVLGCDAAKTLIGAAIGEQSDPNITSATKAVTLIVAGLAALGVKVPTTTATTGAAK
jgi:hypothetical protein